MVTQKLKTLAIRLQGKVENLPPMAGMNDQVILNGVNSTSLLLVPVLSKNKRKNFFGTGVTFFRFCD